MTAMKKFKVGDKVKYVGKSWTEWGNDEMTVEEIVCGNYHCLNPEHGFGSFYEEDLTLCNEESKVLTLEEQKVQLQKQLAEIEQQIAAKKLEEQKKLGEKEVQIALTVNELAWITVNVGQSSIYSTTEEMKNDFHVSKFDFMKSPQDGQHSALYNKLGDLLKQQFD